MRRPSISRKASTSTLDAEATDPIANLELLYRAPGEDTLSVELPPFEAGATELEIQHQSTCARGVTARY